MSEVPICTCGDDLTRNGGRVHNYVCPCTPKCQHLVSRINIETGAIEQGHCGSRLESEYECHGNGCPLVQLCSHCGTRMDRRGVHNYDCPNNPYLRNHLINHNFSQRIIIQSIPFPPIVDGNYDVSNECSCSICLSNFSDSQVVMKPSACQHCFHDDCMIKWIESSNKNNRKCPLCREQIETIEKQVFQNHQ
jgi:hypothetical protein